MPKKVILDEMFVVDVHGDPNFWFSYHMEFALQQMPQLESGSTYVVQIVVNEIRKDDNNDVYE